MKVEIKSRWDEGRGIDLSKTNFPRKGSPRSKSDVRAKVVHTATNKRRIEIMVTQPVYSALGWKEGSFVSAMLQKVNGLPTVVLSPAHQGIRLTPRGGTTKTIRLSLPGGLLKKGMCAPVRSVPFENGPFDLLQVTLPAEWFPTAKEEEPA